MPGHWAGWSEMEIEEQPEKIAKEQWETSVDGCVQILIVVVVSGIMPNLPIYTLNVCSLSSVNYTSIVF